MAFSNGNDSGTPMSEINVTPLVDVMLVLLIIFMITAPLMSHKTKVELPEANYETRQLAQAPKRTVTIAVTEDGRFFYNDELVTRALLENYLSVEGQKGDDQPEVNIRGDKTVRYRYINEVVNIAQAQGMRKVGFVATRERN